MSSNYHAGQQTKRSQEIRWCTGLLRKATDTYLKVTSLPMVASLSILWRGQSRRFKEFWIVRSSRTMTKGLFVEVSGCKPGAKAYERRI
jgi:hypothetical protein